MPHWLYWHVYPGQILQTILLLETNIDKSLKFLQMRRIGNQKYLIPFRMVSIQDGSGVDSSLFGQGVLVLRPANFYVYLGQHVVRAGNVQGLTDVDFYAPFER